jgi:DHA1 family quinolone resistance protein-like MFS transporter
MKHLRILFPYSLSFTFMILWLIMFLGTFADSISGPAIPYLIRGFMKEEALVVMTLGSLSSSFFFMRTLVNVPGGLIADKFGRKRLLLISILPLPLSYLFLLISNNIYWLIASYLVRGACLGIIVPSINAMIADITRRDLRATSYGIFNLSWILSQIPAPVIGGFLAEISLKLPFMVALIISAAIFLLTFRVAKSVKETKTSEMENLIAHEEAAEKPKINYKWAMFLFGIDNVLLGLANGILSTAFTAYLMYRLGVSTSEMGISFSIGWGITTAVAQIPGGWLADRVGGKTIILVCSIISALLIPLIPLTTSLLQFIYTLGIITFLGNLSNPAYSAWFMDHMPPKRRAGSFGLTEAAFGLGSIAGPMLGGILWTAFIPNAIFPFTIAAAVFISRIPIILSIKT